MGRKWADVDEEDDEDTLVADGKNQGSRFETPVDENGVKTVVEYTERDGKTYKVSRKVRETRMSSWTNKYIQARKSMTPFGKAEAVGAEQNAILTVKSVEEVNFDLVKKLNQQAIVKDDAEDKFYEESIALAESLNKEKKVWTDMRKEKADDAVGVGTEEPKDAAGNSVSAAMKGDAPASGAANKPAAYV